MDAPHPDDPDAPLYTVTQVGAMVGVSPAILRRWDADGLVSPQRSAGGQRRYSRAQIKSLERAVELAGEGIAAPGIQRVMEMEDRIAQLEGELDEARASHVSDIDG